MRRARHLVVTAAAQMLLWRLLVRADGVASFARPLVDARNAALRSHVVPAAVAAVLQRSARVGGVARAAAGAEEEEERQQVHGAKRYTF
eukprot:6579660-Prymnesium_polylepis.2